jgi:hypothetical protein
MTAGCDTPHFVQDLDALYSNHFARYPFLRLRLRASTNPLFCSYHLFEYSLCFSFLVSKFLNGIAIHHVRVDILQGWQRISITGSAARGALGLKYSEAVHLSLAVTCFATLPWL